MAIEVTDLILFALFSGIGTGIGTPIGNAIYRRWIRPHMKKLDKAIIKINTIKMNGINNSGNSIIKDKDKLKDAWVMRNEDLSDDNERKAKNSKIIM